MYIYSHLHIAPRVLFCVVEELEYRIFHCTHLNMLLSKQYPISMHQLIHGTNSTLPSYTTNHIHHNTVVPPRISALVAQDNKREAQEIVMEHRKKLKKKGCGSN